MDGDSHRRHQRNTGWLLHISAENVEEAIAIAKRNPEFEYVPMASIEVRPVKMKEEQTGFIYPTAK